MPAPGYALHVSVPLVFEYEDVLRRRAPALGVSPQVVDAVLDVVCRVGHHREVFDLWRPGRTTWSRSTRAVNQLITTALAEKLSALLTEDYQAERAARGSREWFLRALAEVPDVSPDEAARR